MSAACEKLEQSVQRTFSLNSSRAKGVIERYQLKTCIVEVYVCVFVSENQVKKSVSCRNEFEELCHVLSQLSNVSRPELMRLLNSNLLKIVCIFVSN